MLKTIIALSFVLACGFLLVILSCVRLLPARMPCLMLFLGPVADFSFFQALFNNWLPLLVVATFLLAPLPNLVCSKIAANDDYMDSDSSASVDFGHFLTGFLVLTGLALPITLAHVGEIGSAACVMSISGGLLIYGSIIVYGRFFSGTGDDF